MGGGYLEAAGAEVHLHVGVHDYGHRTPYHRHNHTLPFEPGIALVGRVDAHGCIAEDCLGARGGHDDIFVGLTFHIITQVIELRVLILVDNLLIGEGCKCGRVPVDHAHAAVYQSLVVKVAEHPDHTLRAHIVHGESGALPVARSTQATELLEDDAAVMLCPVPGMAQELLAGEVGFLYPLAGELGHHLGFCGDGGMVSAGHPAGVLSLHTGAAHEDILYRLVEHVAHVEHAGHIWRRDNNRVGLAAVGGGAEESVLHPEIIPFLLDRRGVVFRCQFFHCRNIGVLPAKLLFFRKTAPTGGADLCIKIQISRESIKNISRNLAVTVI